MNRTHLHLTIASAISIVLVGWAFWTTSQSREVVPEQVPTATIENGVQIIDITAKGGYSPRVVEAKAGIPTMLRLRTNGTFDCSASVVVPKLSYQKFLQPSGVEEINISAEEATGTLQGLCSMGMYGFKITFK